MLSNTMICSRVLIESARGKSSPDLSCFPDWLHLLLYSYPIQGGLFEPLFWVCVCVFVCGGGGGGGNKTALLP